MTQEINKSAFLLVAKTDDWKEHDVIEVLEGNGSNLLEEDEEEGYVDYIYFNIYDSYKKYQEREEYDGGQCLLKEMYKDIPIDDIIEFTLDVGGYINYKDWKKDWEIRPAEEFMIPSEY